MVVSEKSLGAELVRLSGHSEGLLWLGERKDSRTGGAFSFSVTNFMAPSVAKKTQDVTQLF